MSKNNNSFAWNDTIQKLFEMEQGTIDSEDRIKKDIVKPCKCCDTSKYRNDYYGDADFDMELRIANGSWTHLSMLWNSQTNQFGIYASGEGEAVTDISFCPKCGRKLC